MDDHSSTNREMEEDTCPAIIKAKEDDIDNSIENKDDIADVL